MLPFVRAVIWGVLLTGALGACPDGWTTGGAYCYRLIESKVSFEDAQWLCASQEAMLVSVSTDLDLNISLALLTASQQIQEAWTCLRYDGKSKVWAWQDGTPYLASTVPWWNDKEPDSTDSIADVCFVLSMDLQKVHNSPCDELIAPLCRRNAFKLNLCDEEDGWRAVGPSCYKTFDEKQTWWDADATCRDNTATLLPLPFSFSLASVIQQSVVCDTADNDVWIASPNVTAMTSQTPTSAPLLQCNYVSVQYYLAPVQGSCLRELKFICVKKQGTCPVGWTNSGDRCYKAYFEQKLPWIIAAQACQVQGAELLHISDSGEQEFVTRQMESGGFPQTHWLGMSDEKQDGTFMWTDGSPTSSSFSNWGAYFPANIPAAVDCGIVTLGQIDALWSDGYCYNSLNYVCERSVGSDVSNLTTTYDCGSANNTYLVGQTCYELGEAMNYAESYTHCLLSGGKLATLRSSQDQAAVAIGISTLGTAWIGLRRNVSTQQFIWEYDSVTVTTTNWLPGQPDNKGGSEDCVEIVNGAQESMPGAWVDVNCNKTNGFICQRSARPVSQTPSQSATVPWSWRCGQGWTLSSTLSTCYLLVTDLKRSWSTARAECLQKGADLVSVTSHREQTQLEAMVRSAGQGDMWTGATDNTVEGGWGWSDGSPFRYLHWTAGQPDNQGLEGEDQNCAVAVAADTLTWDDRNCGERHGYLCEKAAAPPSTPSPLSAGSTSPPTAECRGWAMLSGDYSVADSMLVASSSRDQDHGPVMSRIFPGNAHAWISSRDDSNPWVGVHFEKLVTVIGVITLGGLYPIGWVTSYKLQYRYDDNAPLYWYTNLPGSNDAMVFTGNTDANTPVINTLDLPFAARQVFIYPTMWNGSAPALRWELLGCLEDECSPTYAVSGPLVVPDSNITSSSVSDPQYNAANVRLHSLAANGKLSCWRPQFLDIKQWIQVDFDRVEVLRGVTTRGNPVAEEWVVSYLLLFQPVSNSTGDDTFKMYEEPYGFPMVFSGNINNNTTVTNYLKSCIPTRHVRLMPQEWHGFIALQFDVLVCEAGCQEQALIPTISDEQLTATSSESDHGPQMSRLQPEPTSSDNQLSTGGWQAEFARADQYIQVSLDIPVEIRAVATQGRHYSNHWVETYFLAYSLGDDWSYYTVNGVVKVLSGNVDNDTVHKHYLEPFLAQFVRLYPVTWHGAIGLRWELYGCPGKNQVNKLGCFLDFPDNRDLPYESYTDLLDGMDPLLCSRHCFNKGYYYAGVQARDHCYCGNSFGRYGASNDCTLTCFPNEQFNCGGLSANFIYTTGLTSSFKVCPTGWTRHADQCYSYNSTASDWTSVRAACIALRADLASVADRNVNFLLYSLMGTASEQSLAWIGFNDRREERYFEWSNMEEVVYTDWDLNQPPPLTTGDNKHCVAINNQTGGWEVLDCSRKLPYFCITNPRPSDQPLQSPPPMGCQAGMFAYKWSCYVLREENKTKDEAADVCETFGGQLVTVVDGYEQAFLASLLSSRTGFYWTDVSDLHDPGRFTSDQGEQDVTYTNWAPNMPDSRRHGHCVAMTSGREAGLWSSQSCESTLRVACKLPRDGYPQPRRHPSTIYNVIDDTHACATNWIDTNSSYCYQINEVSSPLQRTWEEAKEDCREQVAVLAIFQDARSMDSFWRQKLLGSSNNFWIGLHALPTGELIWADSQRSTLDAPWSTGQPDTQNGTQTCVELQVTSGTLALRDCSLHRNWLCSSKKGERKPTLRLKDRMTPTAGPPQSCLPLDDTWKRYDRYCYLVNTTAATWRQGRASCQQNQADLASVANMVENMFILSMVQKTSARSVWIGLSELLSGNGYYGWNDGLRISFINWAGQGPDDANGQESCAEMLASTGKWNDNHCAMTQGYVCKRDVSPFPLTSRSTPPPEGGGCLEGFVVFESRCYIILGQQEGKTWVEAFRDCNHRSTPFDRVSLASVRSHRENAFLNTQLLGTGILAWVGLHLVNQTYQWIDNEELTYSNWDAGEPNGGQQEGCVHLYSTGANSGRWNDADCSRRLGWICESDRFAYADMPTTTPSACPGSFLRFDSSCYLFTFSPLTQEEAEKSCVSRGAHLVSVTSQVEQDYIYLLTSGNRSVSALGVWLGLIGTQVGNATRWTWSDGWPVTFSNWALGGYLHTNSSPCVVMDGNGTWSSQNCSASRPFICKSTSESPPYTPAASSGTCDGDQWTPFTTSCYAFYFSERVGFARAAFSCSQRGAALVSVHDNVTNTFLQSQVEAGSALPVWIGFKRSDNDAFFWRDGSPVDFINWESNYPRGTTDDGTVVQCAQLSPWSGQWVDQDCSSETGYICMKSMVFETSTVPATSRASSSTSISRTPMTNSPSVSRKPTFASVTATRSRATAVVTRSSGVTSRMTSYATATPTGYTDTTARTTQRAEKQVNTQSSKGGDQSEAVAGGIVGGVVVLILLTLAIVYFVQRLRNQSTAVFTSVLYREADDAVTLF